MDKDLLLYALLTTIIPFILFCFVYTVFGTIGLLIVVAIFFTAFKLFDVMKKKKY